MSDLWYIVIISIILIRLFPFYPFKIVRYLKEIGISVIIFLIVLVITYFLFQGMY